MISFLFWNLMGRYKPERLPILKERIVRIVLRYEIDICIFAEPSYAADEMIETFAKNGAGCWNELAGLTSRTMLISKSSKRDHSTKYETEDGRFSLRRLRSHDGDLLLGLAHLPSQLRWTTEDLAMMTSEISREIRKVEAEEGHMRTILVGDFNQNPFDSGITSSHGLHAVMAKEIAKTGARVVSSRPFPFFYNPMWSFFGDRTAGPPGTYFYASSVPICYHWNMFDQVLLRPELADRLK